MRWLVTAVVVATLAGAIVRADAQQSGAAKAAQAKTTPMMVTTGSPTAPKEKPLLPDAFAGWVATDKPKTVTDAAELDSANAAALKEYGCAGGMMAGYKRGDETLKCEGAELSGC